MTLGSLGKIQLAYDVGLYIGKHLKNEGYDYYVIGPLDILHKDAEDYFYRVNKSPYVTAQVYEEFGRGLSVAGVIPVYDGRTSRIDSELFSTIERRYITYPILVDSIKTIETFRKVFSFEGNFIVKNGEQYEFYNFYPFVLSWNYEREIDGNKLRLEVLSNAIIYISRGEIKIKEIFGRSGVIVFSDDPEILTLGKQILEKGSGPGRVPW